jgi:hypothetical protein
MIAPAIQRDEPPSYQPSGDVQINPSVCTVRLGDEKENAAFVLNGKIRLSTTVDYNFLVGLGSAENVPLHRSLRVSEKAAGGITFRGKAKVGFCPLGPHPPKFWRLAPWPFVWLGCRGVN